MSLELFSYYIKIIQMLLFYIYGKDLNLKKNNSDKITFLLNNDNNTTVHILLCVNLP